MTDVALTPEALDRDTRVVDRDSWDTRAFTDAVAALPALEAAVDRLANVSSVGLPMAADTFALLKKAAPQPLDDGSPQLAVNRAIRDQLLDASAYRDMRQYTVGDNFAAGMAAASFETRLTNLYSQLADVQKQATEAQERADAVREALEDMLAGAGVDEEAELPGEDLEALAGLRDEAAAAAAALDGAVDDAVPMIGQAVRAAADQAAAELGQEQTEARRWGTDPGELARKDPSNRIRLGRRLLVPRTRRIAEQFGRYRSLSWGAREKRYDSLPTEIHDIKTGSDLPHVLPCELALLTDAVLEDVFLLRYAENKLLQYELRSVERKGRGAVIYCADGSSSMDGPPEIAATGLGLALLGIAKDEERAFHVCQFGGPGRLESWDFACPADFATDRMLDYAETFIRDGGTDFVTPLAHALRRLEDEHAATGKTEASIVFATDGQAVIPDEFIETFNEAKARLGFAVYAICIGDEADAESLLPVTDHLAEISSFGDGDIAMEDVFRKVST